jgi:hypothetical protein
MGRAITLPDGSIVSSDDVTIKKLPDGSVTITLPDGRVITPVDPDAIFGTDGRVIPRVDPKASPSSTG